jgi:hypothetical protein
VSAKWSETLSAFWYGANGCEYVAFKGSHQILEFPTWEYPKPPTRIIQHTERIETAEEFDRALNSGKWFVVSYEEVSE